MAQAYGAKANQKSKAACFYFLYLCMPLGYKLLHKKKKITLLGEDEKKLCVIKARLIMSLKNTNTGTQGAHRRSLVVKSLTYMHRDPIWTLVPVLAAPLFIQLPGSWLRFSK